jgi:hypothetical protein
VRLAFEVQHAKYAGSERVDFGDGVAATEGDVKAAIDRHHFVRRTGEKKFADAGCVLEVVDSESFTAELADDEQSIVWEGDVRFGLCGAGEKRNGQRHQGEDGKTGQAVYLFDVEHFKECRAAGG